MRTPLIAAALVIVAAVVLWRSFDVLPNQAAHAASVSFSRDIAPVLTDRCAACHLTGEEAGGLALHARAAYSSLVGKQSEESEYLVVDPGAPDKSYLIMKLEGTQVDHGGMGERMPMGETPLDDGIVGRIRDWIAAGAPKN